MPRFQDIVTDNEGNGLPGAIVTVRDYPSGNLSTLTADSGGSLTNPIVADANGAYYFNAANAIYSLEFRLLAYEPAREVRLVNLGNLVDSVTLAALTGAALIGTVTGDTVQAELNKIGTKDEGTLPATASLTPFIIGKSAAGNASGTSDWRALIETSTFTGAFGATQINGSNVQHNLLHTAGTVASAIWLQGYAALGVPSTVTTTGAVSSLKGIELHISHTGSGAVSSAHVFSAMGPDLDVGVGTVAKFHNYHSDDLSGGGVSTRITTETFGYFQANSAINGAPLMAAYASELSGGTGRWGLYFTGGANNCLAGRLRIGDTTAPADALEVHGYAKLTQDGTITAASSYHELVSGNNDYVAHVRSLHATTPNGLRIRFTAAAPNDKTHLFLLCEDSGGTKSAIYSDGTLFHQGSVSVSGGVGYATGAGGAVTQATSKATGVTLNKVCGAITLNNAALAASTVVSFTLTNSLIAADDDVRMWVKSGNASVGSYRVAAEGNAAGSRTIVVENKTAGSLSEAIVLGFNILKAAAA